MSQDIFLLMVILVLTIVIVLYSEGFDRVLEIALVLLIRNGKCYVVDMEKETRASFSRIYSTLHRLERTGRITSVGGATGRRSYHWVAAEDGV